MANLFNQKEERRMPQQFSLENEIEKAKVELEKTEREINALSKKRDSSKKIDEIKEACSLVHDLNIKATKIRNRIERLEKKLFAEKNTSAIPKNTMELAV